MLLLMTMMLLLRMSFLVLIDDDDDDVADNDARLGDDVSDVLNVLVDGDDVGDDGVDYPSS